MIDKFATPTETPKEYGTVLLIGVCDDTPGVYQITGSGGSGYLIHQEVLADTLSPAAIKEGTAFGDYLDYPEKTSACIVQRELSGKGLFRHKPREQSNINKQVVQRYPEYSAATMDPAERKRIQQAIKRSAKKIQQPER